jgi:mono/diheme cytochrome c family protein
MRREDFGLEVSWEGPGIARQEIPASALSHPGVLMTPVGEQPFAVDAARAARGSALFAQLNCAACHQGDMAGTKAKPLAELALTGTRLPERRPGGRPAALHADAG